MSAPNIAGAPLPQRARRFWRTRFSGWRESVEAFLERERGQLPPWFVVGFGTGIAVWFALDQPRHWAAFLCISAALALAGFSLRGGRAERAAGWFGLAMMLGCVLVWARANFVAAPRLQRPLVIEFQAKVERVETRAAKKSAGFDDEPGALAARPFASCSRDSCIALLERGGRRWQILATRSAQSIEWQPLVRACAEADIVVSSRWLPRGCTPRWLKLDRDALGRTGGVAVYLGRKPRLATVAGRIGGHPWAADVPNRMRYGPASQEARLKRGDHNAPIRDRT